MVVFARRDRILRSLTSVRLLVFPRDGGAFDGLLVDADESCLRFADVHRRSESGSTPAPGELVIERARIAYSQIVPAEQPGTG